MGGVAIIQYFVNPEFGMFLKHRAQTTTLETGRGVVSLAPEPSFYGSICLLLMIVGYLNFKGAKHYRLWMGILLFQLVILSRSTLNVFVMIGAYGIYLFIKALIKNPLKMASYTLLVALFIISLKALEPYISDYRAGKQLLTALNYPYRFLVDDYSINERFIHAFFPIYGFFESWGFPHFYGKFNNYMRHIYFSWDWIDYISYYRNNYTRIMSSVGCALYELGWVGLMIFYVLFKDIKQLMKFDFTYLLIGLLFFFTLMNAMPLTNGLVGFVLGNIIYRRYHPLPKPSHQ